jgi:AcrR family transcriptional regulator
MKAARRHHNADTAYPRGEETRSRIIDTAVRLFGERGFDGVSTREIATQAEVPAPSLQYYFENKEGLYQACIEHLQDSAYEVIGPVLENTLALLKTDASSERLIDAYCAMLDCLADFLLGTADAASRALFVARYRMSPEAALKKKGKFGNRLQECFQTLAQRIVGDNLSREDARLVAMTINGQLMSIYFARDHLKEQVGWDDFTPARLSKLKQLLRQQTTALFKVHKRG